MPADSPEILYDVFISYARKDANMGAAPLDAALQPRCRVWRDIRNIDPTQPDFTVEIEKAIEASQYVVVCVTPDIVREDSYVHREISYAKLLKKLILVARFADTLPPEPIRKQTRIDFFSGWDSAFEKLWRWISGSAIESSAPAKLPTAPAPDPYRAYVEMLYVEVVESLRISVFSDEAITLRTVESAGDVPRKTHQLNPKFISYTLRDIPEPIPTTPTEFESLHAAYASATCERRVLLLGEPGAGKTTSLLAFARDAAAARLNDASQPLPVFARIGGWDSAAQTPLAEWLARQNEGNRGG